MASKAGTRLPAVELPGAEQVLDELRALGDPAAREGMARFGITTDRAYGVSVTTLRGVAKRLGTDHALAQALWDTGVHEARILAALVEDPAQVTRAQMDRWARDFDSWDVCDGCCYGLFDRTPFAWEKARQWSGRRPEYVKRGAFAIIAALAVHDRHAPDERFLEFLPIVRREAGDDRNFVKKAVNWALRQVGKRNASLNAAAIDTALAIREDGTRAGRWIAADALRELRSEAVQARLFARDRSAPR
jgi:3-methyladenine DNA glycosylase AlkD